MKTGEPNVGARNRPAREESESADCWRAAGAETFCLQLWLFCNSQRTKLAVCISRPSSWGTRGSAAARSCFFLEYGDEVCRSRRLLQVRARRSRFYVFKLPSYPQGALARRVAPHYRACGFRPIPPVAAPPFRGRPRLHSRRRLRLAARKACGRTSSKVGKGARSRRMSPPLASLDTSRRAREISPAKGVARRHPGCAARPVPAKLSQRAPR